MIFPLSDVPAPNALNICPIHWRRPKQSVCDPNYRFLLFPSSFTSLVGGTLVPMPMWFVLLISSFEWFHILPVRTLTSTSAWPETSLHKWCTDCPHTYIPLLSNSGLSTGMAMVPPRTHINQLCRRSRIQSHWRFFPSLWRWSCYVAHKRSCPTRARVW